MLDPHAKKYTEPRQSHPYGAARKLSKALRSANRFSFFVSFLALCLLLRCFTLREKAEYWEDRAKKTEAVNAVITERLPQASEDATGLFAS
ncbi:hypothetical protein [Chitinibacter tainanensis]|uniref:hypothetical protein n=1 Tax=Chitinibacter tainanensis TaxID=230667 RepID=UPI00235598E5|nr:hypothetical protein [Chitinibacter tainanensis]